MFVLSVLFALLALAFGLAGFGEIAAVPFVISATLFGLFLTLFLVSLTAALTNDEFRRDRRNSSPLLH